MGKKLTCSCCGYNSTNYSEFLTLTLSPENQHEHSHEHKKPVENIIACLDCAETQYQLTFDLTYKKMAASIRSRKMQANKNLNITQTVFERVKNLDKNKIITPKFIKQILDSKIIGQEKAKSKIAVAVSNHLQRINNPDVKTQKSNILLMGPTGTGKTEMFRTLSTELGIPFVSASATNLTASGYVGKDAADVLVQLVLTAENPYEAQKGIVFIDEIDKLANTSKDESAVNSIRVQQELLRIIEGDIVQVNIGSKMQPHMIDIDTENILFICAGAFVGLKEQLNHSYKPMGILSDDTKQVSKTLYDTTTDDLKKFGLIPEFLGRLPVVAATEELSVTDLKQILTEPKNSIVKQYQQLAATYGMELEFSDSFLSMVATQSITNKTGARGLKSILEKHIESVMYNVEEYFHKKVTISLDSSNQVVFVSKDIIFPKAVHLDDVTTSSSHLESGIMPSTESEKTPETTLQV